jgi:hypothetical protein
MALTEDSILGSFLPTIHVSRVIINEISLGKVGNEDKYGLKMDLSLMVIDSIENEEITSFLNEGFLKQAIIIKVIQSTDQNLTDDLLSGISLENSEYKSAATVVEVDINNPSSIEVDSEGNKKYYFTVSYNINTSPKHVSYITYSDISTEYLTDTFNIQLTPEEIKTIPKKITVDTIINDFQVQTKSYNYLLDDGTIWVGEVLFDEGRYETAEEVPRSLNLVEVPNYKVQDFRGRNIIKRNIVSDQFYDSTKKLIELSPLPSNSTLSINKPPIFGDITKIINSDKTVCLSLFINAKEIIQQNCLYPNVLEDASIDYASLVGLSLLRRKIKNTNENEIQPEDNDIPVVIDKDFTDNQIDLNIATNKYYLLKDQSISRIYEGKYQYGIRMTFLDPTVSILKNRVIVLNSVRKSMLEYYTFCEMNTDPQTEYFEPAVDELYDENKIYSENILPYLDSLSGVTDGFDKNQIGELLKSSLSPRVGSLDGVSMFLKMIDDAITDILGLLSISYIDPSILTTDDTSLSKQSTKEMVEKVVYFKETVHDATDTNKIELSYYEVNDGVVKYKDFISSLYPQTQTADQIYVAPLLVDINATKFYLKSFEDTSAEAKKQKFLLLKNKILEVNTDKSLYTSLGEFDITKRDSGGRQDFITKLISQNNKLMEDNLFLKNSVVFIDVPQIEARKYDQFGDINAVLYPRDTVNIPSNKTPVNILKNISLDLNSEEHLFKYRLLNLVEYAVYNEENKTTTWIPLTKEKLTTLIQASTANILCRLTQYDYSSIEDAGLTNINEYNYNKRFILNLTGLTVSQLTPQPTSTAAPQTQQNKINLVTDISTIDIKKAQVGESYTFVVSLKMIQKDERYNIFCDITGENKQLFRIIRNSFPLSFEEIQKIEIQFFSSKPVSKINETLTIQAVNKNQTIKVSIIGNVEARKQEITKSAPYKEVAKRRDEFVEKREEEIQKAKKAAEEKAAKDRASFEEAKNTARQKAEEAREQFISEREQAVQQAKRTAEQEARRQRALTEAREQAKRAAEQEAARQREAASKEEQKRNTQREAAKKEASQRRDEFVTKQEEAKKETVEEAKKTASQRRDEFLAKQEETKKAAEQKQKNEKEKYQTSTNPPKNARQRR